ncbi:restriction endonuclease subunit S [Vibrio metschnikovii]|uniref:restriction endonuclease subunit S n=1 Tax=Vibrio metschnikovii TaxID=28172 RepID=UPI001C306587|nr:restriction endonuclease subunit S [Vibrio metschnikovii]
MSHLNYLEKLLEGVGTEWQALGDLVTLRRGRVMSKGFLSENTGIFPVYSSQTANDGMIGSIDTYDFDGEYISWTTDGANAGTIFYRKGKFSITNVCGLMKIIDENLLNYKYLYYWLTTEAKKYVYSGMGNPKLMSHQVEKIVVPIPCPDNPEKSLAIQAEIVRILDAFTAMTAELNMRKKQYNYYRDQLLSFEEREVEWKTLGEVALDFGRGKSKHRPRNDPSLYGGDIPFIQTGDIRNAAHTIQEYSQTYSELGLKQSKLWPKGTLCITIAANIAETSILGFDACFPDSVIGFVANPEETSSSYVEYLLSSIKTLLEEKGQGSAQSNINLGTFQNLKLPFPSITEQERIVALLDKFELLTSSIKEGLPCEIELRQKQYEYYRDLLLSFPKSDSDEAA